MSDEILEIQPPSTCSDPVEELIEGTPSKEDTPSDPESETPDSEPSKYRINFITGIIAIALLIAATSLFAVLQQVQARDNQAHARLIAGQTAMVDGDLDKALFQFTAALQIKPGLPGAHKALGQIALANGRADEAVKHFESELKINPSDRLSHLALGCLYTLGIVSTDDPHDLRVYLLKRFTQVAPATWSEDLKYIPGPDTDNMSFAIYHFQYAAEHTPSDPSAEIGLILTHLAGYDLSTARDKLLKLSTELGSNATVDEDQLTIVNSLLDDVNQEEQYVAMLAASPMVPVPNTSLEQFNPDVQPTEVPTSGSMPDLSHQLTSLPAIPGSGAAEASMPPTRTTFGNRYPNQASMQNPNDLNMPVTQGDLTPQPTVKPISSDVNVGGEWVHSLKLANINEAGSVGFRKGETVNMPNTNATVKVVDVSDKKIVLEEQGQQFVWVKGDVGWELQTPLTDSESGNLDITATKPGDEKSKEKPKKDAVSKETGPEVPASH
jgi:hypothetical protein